MLDTRLQIVHLPLGDISPHPRNIAQKHRLSAKQRLFESRHQHDRVTAGTTTSAVVLWSPSPNYDAETVPPLFSIGVCLYADCRIVWSAFGAQQLSGCSAHRMFSSNSALGQGTRVIVKQLLRAVARLSEGAQVLKWPHTSASEPQPRHVVCRVKPSKDSGLRSIVCWRMWDRTNTGEPGALSSLQMSRCWWEEYTTTEWPWWYRRRTMSTPLS